MSDLAALVGVRVTAVADLLDSLAARRLTVATAESLTGGLLAALLTEIPGSSAVVRGGLVVYATDLKHTLAGVDAVLLAECGPVHPDVAAALARGARDRCGASIGVGLTGVAGPEPQNGRPVGTWFCAASGPGDAHHAIRDVSASGAPASTRATVRAAAVRGALRMLKNMAAMDS